MIRPPPGLCHCQTFSSPNVSILIIWDSRIQLRQHPVRGYCRLPHFRGAYILGIMTVWWHSIVASIKRVICSARSLLTSTQDYGYQAESSSAQHRRKYWGVGDRSHFTSTFDDQDLTMPRGMVSDCLLHLYMSYPADYSRYIYFWVQCHFSWFVPS